MQNKNIVIGIEGMVASGKTSICKELIKIIPNSIFIDGGNIYRGISLALAKNNVDISNKNNLEGTDPLKLMQMLKVEFKIENNITEIYIANNKIGEKDIQDMQNSINVSKMASANDNNALYGFARKIIEGYHQKYNIIVSARDLASIYPNMDCHVYVTASLEERTKRRYKQYNGIYTIDKIRDIIIERDSIHEQAGFNKTCKNTITVDVTECINAEESARKILKFAKEKNLINNI